MCGCAYSQGSQVSACGAWRQREGRECAGACTGWGSASGGLHQRQEGGEGEGEGCQYILSFRIWICKVLLYRTFQIVTVNGAPCILRVNTNHSEDTERTWPALDQPAAPLISHSVVTPPTGPHMHPTKYSTCAQPQRHPPLHLPQLLLRLGREAPDAERLHPAAHGRRDV